MARNRPEHRHVVWPIILIGLGIVLLLRNFGLFPWDIWQILAQFWPVILILIGLELLLSRTRPGLSAVVAVVVVLGVILGGATLAAAGYNGASFRGIGAGTQHLSEALGQYNRATVELQHGAGELSLGGLPAESANLMEGDFTYESGGTVSRSFNCQNGDCTLQLRAAGRQGWFFSNGSGDNWQVKLTPRIPINLWVQSGASKVNLDLSAMNLSGLRLDLGASSGTVKLPAQANNLQATVKAGAADLDIEVPQGTAARIHARGGLSSFQIDESRFPRDGDYYVSPDYNQATSRVDLEIDAGVATVRVR